jgi:DNA ligase-1
MLDRLFKRTATGAIQTWEIETDIHRGRYRTISGQLEGKQTASEWTQCKAKNVGRANAVSVCDQAIREAQAAWEKKQRDGYSLTIADARDSQRFQCMLADQYVDATHPAKSRKPRVLAELAMGGVIYSQPKLDGVRLIASKDSMLSRKGRPIVAVPHIAEALVPIFEDHPGLVLDGELYNHELRDDFDTLVSIVRTEKPTPGDIEAARAMQYWVYDCAGPAASANYGERHALLESILLSGRWCLQGIEFVFASVVRSEAEIDSAYQQYLAANYEGQMLRFDVPYENKRSSKLIKRKEFQDKEFLVESIEEGDGNRSGQAGFVCVRERGTNKKFKAGIKAAKPVRLELLQNAYKYVGGEVTVRYNGRTPSGVPRFPRAIAWYPEGRDV